MVRYKVIVAVLLLMLVSFQAMARMDALVAGPDRKNDLGAMIVCDSMERCIQLEVSSSDSVKHSESSSVTLEVDPDLEPGFPVQSYHSAGTFWSTEFNTLVGNIDFDPELEIVVASLVNEPLYAWNSDGSLVEGWPVAPAAVHYPQMGNLSGDSAQLEVVSAINYEVWAYSGSGQSLSGWPQSASLAYMSPAAADVDGDGLDEVFFGTRYDGLYAYKADGTLLPGWPVSHGFSALAIADLDEDGDLEIVTRGYSGNIYAYHHDGTIVDGFPYIYDSDIRTAPAIGDVDGDNDVEIIITTEEKMGPDWIGRVVILSSNGIVERKLSVAQGHLSPPALADMNGDGFPEIIVQSNYSLHCWYGDGTSCPGWPQQLGGQYDERKRSAPVVGDVDGDRHPDIVVTTGVRGIGTTGHVRVYRHNGEPHPRFPKEIDLGTGAVPAIADIDLDGRNEIIITGNYWNGIPGWFDKVWVYDLGGSQHGQIEWGQFGGSPQHRGFYPPPPTLYGVDLYVDAPSLVPTPPDNLTTVSLSYGNYGATVATTVSLTITVGNHLTYIDDTSDIVPEVGDTVITWTLPFVAYFNDGEFDLYLQTPSGAEYGARYSLAGEINSTNPDINIADNTFNTEIMIARQCYFPLVFR